MKHGFIKVAACTPKIRVADPAYNTAQIMGQMEEAAKAGAKLIVFPELCITGYSCEDLFFQEVLLTQAREDLGLLIECSSGLDALVFVGLPIEWEQKLYNVAAAFCNGELLAFIPKHNIPCYAEFYEARHFVPGPSTPQTLPFMGKQIPFGTDVLLTCESGIPLCVACEICEDLWSAKTPSTEHALAGANVIVNLSASNETIGKDSYRELLVRATSARLLAGYVYTSVAEGESTQDLVYGGHRMIAENGTMLAQKKDFKAGILYSELDVHRLNHERRKNTSFVTGGEGHYYTRIGFTLKREDTTLTRTFGRQPFVPQDETLKRERCEEILSIQAYGLKKRMEHVNSNAVVLGLSGGLDSTLALLVAARAFDLMGHDHKGIHTVTMPCFGTTDRTFDNACKLAKYLGATLTKIDIKKAVTQHFKDIKQDPEVHDVTYENSQARERTQILMDLSNRLGALVIGTGDMSELALGWATYNGDHMSMYGVNAGVPKTLVRHVVEYEALNCGKEKLKEVLLDVLATPVSPELLPPAEGDISQKTEDLVGPYELHDFFLYHMLRFAEEPAKVYRLAKLAFTGLYDEETILNWLKVFYRRFFAAQFKRSCLPDGPKVGSVALSPRGDLRMPSDACATLWLGQLNSL